MIKPYMKHKQTSASLWIYGKHAVFAALQNPNRLCHTLFINAPLQEELKNLSIKGTLPKTEVVDNRRINEVLPKDAVHQGIALLAAPLQPPQLSQLSEESGVVLLLDQVTDPHNVGAILRSAAAFGAKGVIVPKQHSPEESGTLAKAASGALELVPLFRVSNVASTLKELKARGYWSIGLDGSTSQTLSNAPKFSHTVLILGAEGTGLRRLTKEHCDLLAKLPIRSCMESLNVSNAAAIALYELSRTLPT